jgi:hypothetical protein
MPCLNASRASLSRGKQLLPAVALASWEAWSVDLDATMARISSKNVVVVVVVVGSTSLLEERMVVVVSGVRLGLILELSNQDRL